MPWPVMVKVYIYKIKEMGISIYIESSEWVRLQR